MRGSHTGEMTFNNVEVPKENILGGLNESVESGWAGWITSVQY